MTAADKWQRLVAPTADKLGLPGKMGVPLTLTPDAGKAASELLMHAGSFGRRSRGSAFRHCAVVLAARAGVRRAGGGAVMDGHLSQMLGALGLPQIAPEPEVIASSLARIRARSLAGLIAGLINENEPLLRASFEGAAVTVREVGGGAVMQFTITEGEPS
jgi:hypothetical protein